MNEGAEAPQPTEAGGDKAATTALESRVAGLRAGESDDEADTQARDEELALLRAKEAVKSEGLLGGFFRGNKKVERLARDRLEQDRQAGEREKKQRAEDEARELRKINQVTSRVGENGQRVELDSIKDEGTRELVIAAQKALYETLGLDAEEFDKLTPSEKEKFQKDNVVLVRPDGSVVTVQGDSRGFRITDEAEVELQSWRSDQKIRVPKFRPDLNTGQPQKDSSGREIIDIVEEEAPEQSGTVLVTHMRAQLAKVEGYYRGMPESTRYEAVDLLSRRTPDYGWNAWEPDVVARLAVRDALPISLSVENGVKIVDNGGAESRSPEEARRVRKALLEAEERASDLAVIGAGSDLVGERRPIDFLAGVEEIKREQPVTIVLPRPKDQHNFENLTAAGKREFLLALGDRLPPDGNIDNIRILLSSEDAGQVEGAVNIGAEDEDLLGELNFAQRERTGKIIKGEIPLSDISDSAELVVALFAGQKDYDSSKNAMALANGERDTLSKSLGEAEARGEDRREAVKRLVGELQDREKLDKDDPKIKDIADKLTASLEARKPREALSYVRDLVKGYKEGSRDRDAYDKVSEEIHGVLREAGLEEAADAIFEMVDLQTPREVLTLADITKLIRSGEVSKAELTAMLEADKRMTDTDRGVAELLLETMQEPKDTNAELARIINDLLINGVLPEQALADALHHGLSEEQKGWLGEIIKLQQNERKRKEATLQVSPIPAGTNRFEPSLNSDMTRNIGSTSLVDAVLKPGDEPTNSTSPAGDNI